MEFGRAIATTSNLIFIDTDPERAVVFQQALFGHVSPSPDCARYLPHHLGQAFISLVRRLTDDLPLELFLDRR